MCLPAARRSSGVRGEDAELVRVTLVLDARPIGFQIILEFTISPPFDDAIEFILCLSLTS